MIKIKIILGNLISNSIKYQKEDSDDKKVFIKVKTDKEGAHIVVEDNGMGIEAAQLERVFEMFHRASNKSIGSGLGLYIVKESVESLNGEIDLTSKAGEGTRIEVNIPSMQVQA
jgi:signal transduction histidine kinase